MKKYSLIIIIFSIFCSCKNEKNVLVKQPIKSLRFIGEQILSDSLIYKNTLVGGLSSIDYANGTYFSISDDKKNARFYELNLIFNEENFSKIELLKVTSIQHKSKGIDLEALRFDENSKHFLVTNEGNIKQNIAPSVFEINAKGEQLKKFKNPVIFQIDTTKKSGLRNNGTFEGLTFSHDKKSFWIGMELPLKQDGKEPKLVKGKYPVRISKLNKTTGALEFQFAYLLDAIPRDSNPTGKFAVNGLPEILNIAKNQFLFIERAYASGHKNGGNDVKIYFVDCINATDISEIKSLKKSKYIPATKTLLFDFETIRSKLTNGVVDNIEGITFGSTLANGNRTLVVVSDNNFNRFSKQLNQFIVFEILN